MNLPNADKSWFQHTLGNTNLCKKLADIKLIICDVDGTLTNGTMTYSTTDEASRNFSIVDGFGMVQAQKAGILIALLSGKAHGSLAVRAKKLNIPESLCIGSQEDKIITIKKIASDHQLKLSEIALIGDDYFDLKTKTAEPYLLFISLQDAPFYSQVYADLVICREGGNHAVRLFIDLVLYIQQKHFAQSFIDHALTC